MVGRNEEHRLRPRTLQNRQHHVMALAIAIVERDHRGVFRERTVLQEVEAQLLGGDQREPAHEESDMALEVLAGDVDHRFVEIARADWGMPTR